VLARCKSLFSYANRLGYCPVNVGAVLKAKKTPRALAKRIASELEIKDVIRHGESDRNFLILGVLWRDRVGDEADSGEPRAVAWMTRLGFRLDERTQHLYRWDTR
jgi:hypothetical protein